MLGELPSLYLVAQAMASCHSQGSSSPNVRGFVDRFLFSTTFFCHLPQCLPVIVCQFVIFLVSREIVFATVCFAEGGYVIYIYICMCVFVCIWLYTVSACAVLRGSWVAKGSSASIVRCYCVFLCLAQISCFAHLPQSDAMTMRRSFWMAMGCFRVRRSPVNGGLPQIGPICGRYEAAYVIAVCGLKVMTGDLDSRPEILTVDRISSYIDYLEGPLKHKHTSSLSFSFI